MSDEQSSIDLEDQADVERLAAVINQHWWGPADAQWRPMFVEGAKKAAMMAHWMLCRNAEGPQYLLRDVLDQFTIDQILADLNGEDPDSVTPRERP